MRNALPIAAAVLALALLGCAAGKRLEPVRMDGSSGIEGTYTVYLYSTKQYAGSEGTVPVRAAIAFLDLEGDDYFFSLDVPEYEYGVVEGLSAGEAVRSAEWFIYQQHGSMDNILYRRIEVDGKTIGYEARERIKPWIYRRDVVNVEYISSEGGKVRVIFETGPMSPASSLY